MSLNYHQFSYEKGDASLQPEIAYQLDGTIGFATSKWGIQTPALTITSFSEDNDTYTDGDILSITDNDYSCFIKW